MGPVQNNVSQNEPELINIALQNNNNNNNNNNNAGTVYLNDNYPNYENAMNYNNYSNSAPRVPITPVYRILSSIERAHQNVLWRPSVDNFTKLIDALKEFHALIPGSRTDALVRREIEISIPHIRTFMDAMKEFVNSIEMTNEERDLYDEYLQLSIQIMHDFREIQSGGRRKNKTKRRHRRGMTIHRKK